MAVAEMSSYKHIAKFEAPLKGITVAPGRPPEPPAHVFTEAEVKEREDAARAEGTTQAEQQANQQIVQLRQQAAGMQSGIFQKLDSDFQSLITEVNGRLPTLIMTLVRRVLIDVKIDADTVKAIVDDTLFQISGETEKMEIRISPGDMEIMQWMVPQFENKYPNLTFKEDPSLSSGDCVLNSRYGLVDATVATKLGKIADDLKGDS